MRKTASGLLAFFSLLATLALVGCVPAPVNVSYSSAQMKNLRKDIDNVKPDNNLYPIARNSDYVLVTATLNRKSRVTTLIYRHCVGGCKDGIVGDGTVDLNVQLTAKAPQVFDAKKVTMTLHERYAMNHFRWEFVSFDPNFVPTPQQMAPNYVKSLFDGFRSGGQVIAASKCPTGDLCGTVQQTDF